MNIQSKDKMDFEDLKRDEPSQPSHPQNRDTSNSSHASHLPTTSNQTFLSNQQNQINQMNQTNQQNSGQNHAQVNPTNSPQLNSPQTSSPQAIVYSGRQRGNSFVGQNTHSSESSNAFGDLKPKNKHFIVETKEKSFVITFFFFFCWIK